MSGDEIEKMPSAEKLNEWAALDDLREECDGWKEEAQTYERQVRSQQEYIAELEFTLRRIADMIAGGRQLIEQTLGRRA